MNKTEKDFENKEKEIKQLFEALRPDEKEIPESVDNAVLDHIRWKKQKTDKLNYKKIYYFFSAAAAVVIISFFIKFSTIKDNAPTKPDIVDIYILNCKITSKQKISPSWDVDKNGVVDNNDINQLAQMIVKIE